MANYRTIKELKSYRGFRIFRLHKDGAWYYWAEYNGKQISDPKHCTRTELYQMIDFYITINKLY